MRNSKSILPTIESEKYEFKTSFNEDVVISLVAFSNTKGGIVYIGISDNGEIKGIHLGKETTAEWVNEPSHENFFSHTRMIIMASSI